MKILLDTHVWIWATEQPDKLGPKMRRLLLDIKNPRAVCTVSTLEIARLIAADNIAFTISVDEWVEKTLGDLKADSFPVTHQIALEAYRLPEPFHRDPADRQIVACARLHEFTVATADERILSWKHVASIDVRK